MPAQADLFYFKLNNGPNVIAQFTKTAYRSARVTVQASSNTEHQLTEVYLMHDNTLAYIRELDLIYTTDSFVTYTASIDSNNVYLSANSSLPNTDLVIFGTLFDNPITAGDKSVDLTKIMQISTSMASLYPDDNIDHSMAMTASLDKRDDIYILNKQISLAIDYMQTPSFIGLSDAEKNAYINGLTDKINTSSNTLSETVKSDIQNYYDATKQLESMTTLTNLDSGFNSSGSALADKVLNSTGKSLFKK